MALDATRLSADILTRLTTDPGNGFSSPLAPPQVAMLKAWTDAIAAAVIAEIKANAQVNVESVSGVAPGPGASGPGTGTVV